MANNNGGRIGGGTGIPEGVKEDVDRLMDEVFYSDGSIRNRLKAIEEKLENTATKADIDKLNKAISDQLLTHLKWSKTKIATTFALIIAGAGIMIGLIRYLWPPS